MAGRKGHSIHRDWRFSAGWQLYFQVKVRQRRKISCGICSKNVYSLIQLTKYSQEKIFAEVRTVHKKSTIHDQLFSFFSGAWAGNFFLFIQISLSTFETIISWISYWIKKQRSNLNKQKVSGKKLKIVQWEEKKKE